MSENTTNGGDATPRREFLRSSAAMAGAALLSGSLLSSSALADSPATTTLTATELTLAVELLTQSDANRECGLLLLIVEHVAATGTPQVENVINVIDRIHGVGRVDTLRRETRDQLRDWSAADAADQR